MTVTCSPYLQGRIRTTMSLPRAPVSAPVVGDFNDDGVVDLIVTTATAYYGFAIERRPNVGGALFAALVLALRISPSLAISRHLIPPHHTSSHHLVTCHHQKYRHPAHLTIPPHSISSRPISHHLSLSSLFARSPSCSSCWARSG
jgi:hypothetical protein